MSGFDSNIAKAMMTNDPDELDRLVNREVLLYTVQRKILCEMTGVVLDVRTAVQITVEVNGRKGLSVFAGEAWDAVAEPTIAKVAELGGTIEIIDGRKL